MKGEDVSPIAERRGAVRIEARPRAGADGWELRVLDEDTRLGIPRLLYVEDYPDVRSRSHAYTKVMMIWFKIAEHGV